jgi:histidinol-phosphate aminotransferase
MTCGAAGGLNRILKSILNPEDEVITFSPYFGEYANYVKNFNGKLVTCSTNTDTFEPNLDALNKLINYKTKALIINNPNNPTGTIVKGLQIAEFMQKVPASIMVIFDEAYAEYADDPEFESGLKYVKEGRNVIVLRTFSKIYGLAAVRVGYGLTSPELAGAIERVMEPFNVNSVAQVAAIAALGDTPHVQNSRETNCEGKLYLYEQFKKLGLQYVPTQANFIFVNTNKNSRQVFSALLQEGVIVRTGDIFGYPDFIRVTVGTMEENERFVRSLKKVLEV